MNLFNRNKPIQIPIYIEVGGEQMNHNDLRIIAAFAKFNKFLNDNLGEPIALPTVVATAKLKSEILDEILNKETNKE